MTSHAEPSELPGVTKEDEAPATGPVAKQPPPGFTPEGRIGSEGKVLNVFSHGILAVWGLLVTLPLLWAVMSSLKTDKQIFTSPWGLPSALHFDNWTRAWSKSNIGDFFLNTILVVGCSLIGTMLLGSMAAYILARFEFPGKRFIYFMFVGGMSFPIILALVPLFFVMKNMSLLNTFHGLILVYIAYSLPFTVFFLTSFFKTLPSSVAEAALIDGASHTRTFFQVMLPMAKPGLISVGIFNFLGQWNQYMLPTV
ncbi:carbohydrate ABC transporter permease, partial [Streptomyces albiflaviniger]|nr:carbohydrate ABC transporter permease [Streptomyces albiflaviniger]